MEYDSVITSRPVLPTGTTWMKLEGVMPSKVKVKVLVAQSCPTLCDPMDCSPPGSFVHGIFQARMLEWVAIPSPGDLPIPGIKPRSTALQVDSLPSKPPGKPRLS